MNNILEVHNIEVKINKKVIIPKFSMKLKRGKVYSIIGPNGCGKTTLLRAISRNIKVNTGNVILNGENIFKIHTKKVAKTMAVLSQNHNNMNDVSVRQLVAYGRYAHRNWWESNNSDDKEIIDDAIQKTNLNTLENRKINTLSGGERQRAWIAMAIAQKPQILFLDEPTTFLDISHQLEILELVSKLNKEDGITILMVLHDINHAAKYSDELIVMKDGMLYSNGEPWSILQSDVLSKVFNVYAEITMDEETDKPIFYAKRVCRKDEV